jgi:hypothetical protein
VFVGRLVRNLARERSWAAAERGAWRVGAAGRRGLKLAALSGRSWRELQIGGADCRPRRGAGRRRWPAAIDDAVGGDPSWERSAGAFGESCFWGGSPNWRIREDHRNVGIPEWYARSAIHRNVEVDGGSGSGPDDFCGLGGADGAVEAAGRGAARFGRRVRSCFWGKAPAGLAWLGFLPSTAREFAKRRAEQDGKTQRGRGLWGRGHTSGTKCGAAWAGWRGEAFKKQQQRLVFPRMGGMEL